MSAQIIEKSSSVISGAQARMARAVLNISIQELAVLAGVNQHTVRRLEAGKYVRAIYGEKIVAIFIARGIAFRGRRTCVAAKS
jgi:DNA-binding XRE family transcriptional regulator